jgi:glycosyltransferase involved in cell wall biosynthesis
MTETPSPHSLGRPHVGFITDSLLDDAGDLLEGGAERHLLHLAGIARQLGADVTVYQRGRRRWQGAIDGIQVVVQPVPLAVLGRVLAQKAARDGCTHLHFQYLERVPWGLSGVCVTATSHAVYWDIPYVDHYRHWYPGDRLGGRALPVWRLRERNRCLLAVGRCSRVLAVDTSLLRLVQSHRPSLRQRIEVVMNFSDLADDPSDVVDGGTVDPFIEPIADAHREGHSVVLVPRNLSFVRGGAWLCDIVERTAALCVAGQQCHFFLTGVAIDVYGRGDRYRRLFQERLDTMSSEARGCIHLLGGLPHSSMRNAYRASDMVLIPTFGHEGTSLAALEAMGEGVPVIATNVGGLNDAIRDGITGLLVPPDPEALASAVAHLTSDTELRARLGAEGRRVVAAAFTSEHWRTRAEGFARRAGWAAAGEVAG